MRRKMEPPFFFSFFPKSEFFVGNMLLERGTLLLEGRCAHHLELGPFLIFNHQYSEKVQKAQVGLERVNSHDARVRDER